MGIRGEDGDAVMARNSFMVGFVGVVGSSVKRGIRLECVMANI